MIKYLIILLDRTSVSFCHYSEPSGERRLIDSDTLRKAIRYAMMQNLSVQVVYPHYEVPDEIKALIETVDSCRIVPVDIADGSADVVVVDGWDFSKARLLGKPTTVRVMKNDFFTRSAELISLLGATPRVNVVITDVQTFSDDDFVAYGQALDVLGTLVAESFLRGVHVSCNLLTDRMMLEQMNNCGAGDESITLSPEGKLYVCPAYYYDDDSNSIGCISKGGLNVKNSYLYTLKHEPICRHCDAWHCKRCIWLNQKTTREVNTPSHEQCVASHIEREASRRLLAVLNNQGNFSFKSEIPKLDYNDPFDNRETW